MFMVARTERQTIVTVKEHNLPSIKANSIISLLSFVWWSSSEQVLFVHIEICFISKLVFKPKLILLCVRSFCGFLFILSISFFIQVKAQKKVASSDSISSQWNELKMNGSDESNARKRDKRGILRIDINKPRSSSGGSVEFRDPPALIGQVTEIDKRKWRKMWMWTLNIFSIMVKWNVDIFSVCFDWPFPLLKRHNGCVAKEWNSLKSYRKMGH